MSTCLWTVLLWIAHKIDSNMYHPFYLMRSEKLMTWRHAEKYPVKNNVTESTEASPENQILP